MMYSMGIDPGNSGGFALIPDEGKPLVFKMPETAFDLWSLVWAISKRYPIRLAIIERVHAFRGQGVTSTFTFGKNYGMLLMALTAAEIPFRDSTPQAWMKHYHMKKDKAESKTQWKRRLRGVAEQRWPSVASEITNYTADALLIAGYAHDQHHHARLEAANSN